MAITAIAGAELLYSGYQAVAGNQKSQQAKGQAQTLIDQQAKQVTSDQATANAAASSAAASTKARAVAAFGQSATVLTSPRGAAPATTQRKTLLGL